MEMRSRAAAPLREALGVGADFLLLMLKPIPWSWSAMEWVFICISGQDPKVVKQCALGQRISSCRVGMQVVLGGAFVATACFVALTKAIGQSASPAALGCAAILVSSIIVLIDIAAIEKARQLQGEREASAFRIRGPRKKLGWALVGGMTLSRFALATVNASFIATLLLTVLLHKDIETVLADDAKSQNASIVASATSQVDEIIGIQRENFKAKESTLINLASARPAYSAGAVSTVSESLDKELGQVNSNLEGLRKQVADADGIILHQEKMADCEKFGVKCTGGNSGRLGPGPLFQFAKQQLDNAKEHRKDLMQQIDEQERAAALLAEKRSQAIARQESNDKIEQDRYADMVTVARQEAKEAKQDYMDSENGREALIAQRERAGGLAEPKAGLSAEISALDRLSTQPGNIAWFASLKALLILLELNAVASVLLWPSRQQAAIQEFADHIVAVEDTASWVERKRHQRPSPDAFGKV